MKKIKNEVGKVGYKIVFSDIDGTLLSSDRRILPKTRAATDGLREKGVPFVLVSARSPSGIYSVEKEFGLSCPIIAYSGALMLDEDGNEVFSKGFSRSTARRIVDFLENSGLDCAWSVFSGDTWITKDRKEPRIAAEEKSVKTEAVEGTVELLDENAVVGKVLCICAPDELAETERRLKEAFPELSILRSTFPMLEIMENGVTKGSAVRTLCELKNIPISETVAFGDNYNDLDMLNTVGLPFLMGNAPDALKKIVPNITADNNSEGIFEGLVKAGLCANGDIS